MKYLKLFEDIFKSIESIDDDDVKDVKDILQDFIDEYNLEYDPTLPSGADLKGSKYSLELHYPLFFNPRRNKKIVTVEILCFRVLGKEKEIDMISESFKLIVEKLKSFYNEIKCSEDTYHQALGCRFQGYLRIEVGEKLCSEDGPLYGVNVNW